MSHVQLHAFIMLTSRALPAPFYPMGLVSVGKGAPSLVIPRFSHMELVLLFPPRGLGRLSSPIAPPSTSGPAPAPILTEGTAQARSWGSDVFPLPSQASDSSAWVSPAFPVPNVRGQGQVIFAPLLGWCLPWGR